MRRSRLRGLTITSSKEILSFLSSNQQADSGTEEEGKGEEEVSKEAGQGTRREQGEEGRERAQRVSGILEADVSKLATEADALNDLLAERGIEQNFLLLSLNGRGREFYLWAGLSEAWKPSEWEKGRGGEERREARAKKEKT
eukprot:761948-Hanusia_phi.AAC.1